MALTISNRLPLSRFIWEPSWTPVRGTYLYPLKLLDVDESPTDPNDYLEVIQVVPVTGVELPSPVVVAYLCGTEDNIQPLKR